MFLDVVLGTSDQTLTGGCILTLSKVKTEVKKSAKTFALSPSFLVIFTSSLYIKLLTEKQKL